MKNDTRKEIDTEMSKRLSVVGHQTTRERRRSEITLVNAGFILERALAPMAQKNNSGAGNFR